EPTDQRERRHWRCIDSTLASRARPGHASRSWATMRRMDPTPASRSPWPRDARAACAFTFDLDAETPWIARGVTQPVTLSQGRFGAIEAVPRILQLLRAAQLHASFFIPAWVAGRYPDTVRAIAEQGHEIGCHGDEHERVTDLPPEREEEILLKSVDVLT